MVVDGVEVDISTCADKLAYIAQSNLWQDDFFDVMKVLEFGEKKHPRKEGECANWLTNDGNKSSFKDMHDSMFHHLAESFGMKDIMRKDAESNLDPLLHLACRTLMMYTRLKRNIIHRDDK